MHVCFDSTILGGGGGGGWRAGNQVSARRGEVYVIFSCERFETRSHFKMLSLIVQLNVVPNRTVVVDSD